MRLWTLSSRKAYWRLNVQNGMMKDVRLFHSTSLWRARVPGRGGCLARSWIWASPNSQLYFRRLTVPWQDGRAFPYPRSKSEGNSTHDLDSSHQGQWLLCWPWFLGLLHSWGHEAQINFPAASQQSRFSAQSALLLQSTLCMEETEYIFHFSSCRAPFSRSHLQELVYLPCHWKLTHHGGG